MEVKKDILIRVYLIYGFICFFSLAILFQIGRIQFVQGDYWKSMADSLTMSYRTIDAARGNIFATDGSLLATSIPIYDVRVDLLAPALTDNQFKNNIDSLAFCLSRLFNDRPASDYKRTLIKVRKSGSRYFLLKRNVSYAELQKMRAFPLFNLGRYKGGLIVIEKNRRERPFRQLASRTIGYWRIDQNPVGIEGAFDDQLKGVSGKRLMQKIAGNVWKPVNDRNEIEPRDGNDILTSIDINLQDVAQNALMKQMTLHKANKGCVAVMEVATGEIKAISNLTKTGNDLFVEDYNYAIGNSSEPGSTFKLMSMMAAIEDGYLDLRDSVDTRHGEKRFGNQIMRDSREGGYGKITMQRTFEVSSNVGVSTKIDQYYSKKPQAFVDRLRAMGVDIPLNLQIKGETAAKIRNVNEKGWSRVSLPWMSIGYEVQMTPLQVLTFYNAVANNGTMVKPLFVKEVRRRGKPVQKFEPMVLKDKICAQSTLIQARQMLEGVVEQGTATNLKNDYLKIAGKTGTAQIANNNQGYNKVSYQASFAGYFPADNPLYSCIVVIYSPSNSVIYGSFVAGPIFREIADKIYASRSDMHQDVKDLPVDTISEMPVVCSGNFRSIESVCKKLKITIEGEPRDNQWVSVKNNASKLVITDWKSAAGKVPNVLGMDLMDAMYLLENAGLEVKPVGRGIVRKQSLSPGTPIGQDGRIIIELS